MSDLENQELPTQTKGKLYVVSTPIGNSDDISLRALKVMKECDFVVAEEPKEGAKLLHKYNISRKLEFLNEQNEYSKSQELLELLNNGKDLALISDCGTPVFADPGFMLVKSAINAGINVIVVPGVSSIMTALVRSTFDITQFIFAGFLSRDKDLRVAQLNHLKEEFRTIVLLETPYRLLPFLEAAASVMPDRLVYIGCNLTMPFESHHYGSFQKLLEKFSDNKFKGEFVIVFEGKLGNNEDSEIFTAKELSAHSGDMANLENIMKLKTSYNDRPSRDDRGDRRGGFDRGGFRGGDRGGRSEFRRPSGDGDFRRNRDDDRGNREFSGNRDDDRGNRDFRPREDRPDRGRGDRDFRSGGGDRRSSGGDRGGFRGGDRGGRSDSRGGDRGGNRGFRPSGGGFNRDENRPARREGFSGGFHDGENAPGGGGFNLVKKPGGSTREAGSGDREFKPRDRESGNRDFKPRDRESGSRDFKPRDRESGSRDFKPRDRESGSRDGGFGREKRGNFERGGSRGGSSDRRSGSSDRRSGGFSDRKGGSSGGFRGGSGRSGGDFKKGKFGDRSPRKGR
jgi:16S rRNA (cytidine1402-2'-O)-methyltransferase